MSFPSIILFGDSLTEQSFAPDRRGHGSALSNAYARRADVLNRGVSGYNTDWLLPFFESIIASPTTVGVLLWIIMVGANDSCLPGTKHHVSLVRFKENIAYMVNKIFETASAKGEKTIPKVLLVAPPPIDSEMLKVHHRLKGTDRDLRVTRKYAEAVLEAGQELKAKREGCVEVLDFHTLLLRTASRDENAVSDTLIDLTKYLTDGLHMGPKGYKVLFDGVTKTIADTWSELTPSNLRLMSPWWGDLDVVKNMEQQTEENQTPHQEL